MSDPYKILFVCTGNICRSPTAEGIMTSLIKNEGLEDKIWVDSAGTHGWHQGEPPDTRSIHCAKGFGIDLTFICSRPMTPNDFKDFDLILVMDEANCQEIKHTFKGQDYSKVKKLLSYAPGWGTDVPDPYYNNGFDRVFMMIEDACHNLLDELKQKL